MLRKTLMLNSLKRAISWMNQHPGKSGTLAGWLQQSASIYSSLLVLPLLFRVLSKDDVGRWFAFQGFLNMANLVDFGVGFAISRQAAHCFGGGKKNSGSDFLDFGAGWDGLSLLRVTAERIKICTVLLAALVGVAIFELILPHTELLDVTQMSKFRWTWYCLMGSSLLISSAAVENTILNGLGKVYVTRLLTAAFFFLNGTLIMCAAALWKNISEMAMVSLIAAFVYRVSAWCAVRKIAPQIFYKEKRKKWNRALIFPLLKVAAPVGFVNIGSFLVSSIQSPLIGAFLGPSAVAPFYLAQKIGQFINQAARQVLMPQIPLFTKMIGSGDLGGARKIMVRTLFISWVGTVLACVLFFVLSPLVARWVFGAESYVETNVLFFMSVDYMILGIAVSFGYFVLASGRNPFVYSTLGAGFLNLALLFLLLPKIGLLAIPLSSLFSGILTNYWYNIYWGKFVLQEFGVKR
jgi:Membrane protein involved in the export of O-antigen and teichoic acid